MLKLFFSFLSLVLVCTSCKLVKQEAFDIEKEKVRLLQLQLEKITKENLGLVRKIELMDKQLKTLINTLPKPGGPNPNDGRDATSEEEKIAAMDFEKTYHDFGNVEEGQVLEYAFKFLNSSDFPLIFSETKTSCGCTVADWSSKEIAPGKKGEIKVKFYTKGRTGVQIKTISLQANTLEAETRLFVKANVL